MNDRMNFCGECDGTGECPECPADGSFCDACTGSEICVDCQGTGEEDGEC